MLSREALRQRQPESHLWSHLPEQVRRPKFIQTNEQTLVVHMSRRQRRKDSRRQLHWIYQVKSIDFSLEDEIERTSDQDALGTTILERNQGT